MSLNWDLSKVKDWKELNEDKTESVITDSIIWNTMFTDIGWEITEKNEAEFYARIHLIEKLFGASLVGGDGEEKFIEPKDVHRRVGLSVNVAPETRTKWLKRQLEHFFRDAIRDYNKAIEEGNDD